MEIKGKGNRGILISSQRGYKIDKDGSIINPKGNKINGYLGRNGYPAFTIRVGERSEGDSIRVMSHRLQAYQKFGNTMFESGVQVRHLNGDPSDNSWDNIEIGTASQNMMDRPREVRVRLSRNAVSKRKDLLSKELIDNIKADHKAGMGYKSLSKKYNKPLSTLSYHLSKKAKRVAV